MDTGLSLPVATTLRAAASSGRRRLCLSARLALAKHLLMHIFTRVARTVNLSQSFRLAQCMRAERNDQSCELGAPTCVPWMDMDVGNPNYIMHIRSAKNTNICGRLYYMIFNIIWMLLYGCI